MSAAPIRNFSAATPKGSASVDTSASTAAATSSDDSIFAAADYFKDVKPDDISKLDLTNADSATTQTAVEQIMFMDANDSLGSTMAYAAKDVDNLIQGI